MGLFGLPFGRSCEEIAAEEARRRTLWQQSSNEQIESKVDELVAEEYGVEIKSLTDDTNFFTDLDDSMEYVGLMLRCEEEFGIEIPDEEVEERDITTVGRMKAYVVEKLHSTVP